MFLGILLTALFVVTACSSSSSGSSDSTAGLTAGSTAASTSSAGGSAPSGSGSASPSGTPVSVGVVCSCTGPYADNFAAVGKTVHAWADSVNAAGGINGHPVNLDFKDDAGNPGNSATAAKALISDHVAVILDATLLSQVWTKDAADAHIPVVGGDLTSPIFYTDPNAYPAGGTIDYTAYADIMTAKQAGAKNLGVIYCSEVPDCQELFKGLQKAGKELGVPVTYSSAVSLTAPNYTAQCVGAKSQNVTALFIASNATGFAHVAQDCDQQGYDPIYIEQGDGFKMLLASTPGLKDHLWAPFATLPMFADKPAVQQLNQAVDKYYPGLRTSDEYDEYVVEAWAGGRLIEAAVKATGLGSDKTISAEQLTNGLNSLKGETLGGLAPPLTFHAGQPHSTNCWYTGRVQNGVPALADDGKLTCKKG